MITKTISDEIIKKAEGNTLGIKAGLCLITPDDNIYPVLITPAVLSKQLEMIAIFMLYITLQPLNWNISADNSLLTILMMP